ncbi:MAG: neutral zinc metallopeptidase [Acidimicrobiales bacterium]|nr:neutral zinc metallopeptidase [Acidimicrobiales bacterium]
MSDGADPFEPTMPGAGVPGWSSQPPTAPEPPTAVPTPGWSAPTPAAPNQWPQQPVPAPPAGPAQPGPGPHGQPGQPGPGPYGQPQPGWPSGPPQAPPGYGYPGPGQPPNVGGGGFGGQPPGYGGPYGSPGGPPQFGGPQQFGAPPPKKGSKAPLIIGVVAVLALVAVVGGVLLSRQGSSDDDVATGRDGRSTTTVERSTDTTRKRKDRTVTKRSDDEVIEAALRDVEGFWNETYPPLYGGEYEPLAGGYHSYGPRTELPDCPGIFSYDDIAQNAFYCPDSDLIAWDQPNLMAPLRKEFGELTLGIVMAHEMGHAVQFRVGFEGRTVTLEQQADCFAGAWVRSVIDGDSKAFTVGPKELDSALAGMLLLRDTPGVAASDPNAHGSAFDRVGALKDGFDNGARSCADYTDDTVAARLVQLPFTTEDELANNGNLPYDQIVDLSVVDLEDYWTQVFTESGLTWDPVDTAIPFNPDRDAPSCGGDRAAADELVGAAFYCEDEDFVAWDDEYLAPALYEQGGDFAVATVIGTQYSVAVQSRLAVPGTPLGLSLAGDCLTGTWAASLFLQNRATGELSLSPGDLDEAILALLALGDAPDMVEQGKSDRGSGFQRVGAYQDGFLNGVGACDRYSGS